jgi:outer membrane protein assembly factor BamB
MADDDDDTTTPGEEWPPPDEGDRTRDGDTLPTDDRPSRSSGPDQGAFDHDDEDELPPTGAHEIVFPTDDDEEELADRIPSFEEYRRQREESARGGAARSGEAGGREFEERLGGDEPEERYGGDEHEERYGGRESEEPIGSDEPEERLGDEPGERHGGDEGEERFVGDEGEERYVGDEGEERYVGDEGEYARQMFGGTGGGEPEETLGGEHHHAHDEDDLHDGGDTLDGEDALVGVSLPEDDERSFESAYEEELAREAADIFPTGDEHTAEEIHQRRLEAHRRHRRNGRIRLLILVVVLALIVFGVVHELGGSSPSKAAKPPPHVAATPTSVGTGKSHLQAGLTDSALLPRNLLISDWGSYKLLVISPKGQTVWTYHPTASYELPMNPDYAFFTPSGKEIVVSEESHQWVEVLKIAGKQVVYSYGHYNKHGKGANYLHDPSAALEEGADLVIPDIRNCRVITTKPPYHAIVATIGTIGACTHNPPLLLDSPESAFPLTGGGTVVTESGGAIDLLNADGKLARSFTVPGLKAPRSVNETSSGDLVGVDHTHPGAVEIFTTSGKVLWSYRAASGAGELRDPAMALVLPDGNVLVSDEYNDRVIVIDRSSKRIIWQYGHTGVPGGGAGYLDVPVGIDFVPPDSLIDRFPGAKSSR